MRYALCHFLGNRCNQRFLSFSEISLLAEEPQDQTENNADEDGGGEGEVESEFVSFDDEITGESADPGDLLSEDQENPDDDDQNPDEDKKFSESS
jgi:hypothetical protein